MTRISVVFVLLLISCKPQNDLTKEAVQKNLFTYQICVQQKPIPGRVISNKKVGISDTTIAFVSGIIRDVNLDPVLFTNVVFRNLQVPATIGVSADFEGMFKFTLSAGFYEVIFESVGHNSVSIDTLELISGQIQEIEVDLGRASGFATYEIKSKVPLTKKKLQKRMKEISN